MSLAIVAVMGILLVFLLVVGFCVADSGEWTSEVDDSVKIKSPRRKRRPVPMARRRSSHRKAA